MSKKQGEFLTQLRARRPEAVERKAFNWKDDLATPKRDRRLVGSPAAPPKKSQPDPEPLPTKLNGQIDLDAIDESLEKQLKKQRKER